VCFLQMTSKLRLGAPIERHAQDIYTRAIYERFCYLLYKSMDFVIMSAMGIDLLWCTHWTLIKMTGRNMLFILMLVV